MTTIDKLNKLKSKLSVTLVQELNSWESTDYLNFYKVQITTVMF